MQITVVPDYPSGVEKAKEILYEKVDKKTVLFLSGGVTPKGLYATLADEKILRAAAVGMIDERYGKKFHENSNELMVRDSGLLSYLENVRIPFYPILQKNISREETAAEYDRSVRDLFFHFPKSVAIMGIGTDGHIASVVPNRKDFIDPMFDESKKQIFVGEFSDPGKYSERIGMTFAGLTLIDYFIVFAFGKEKKKALKKMFEAGNLEEIPARFFPQSAAENTVIITDQQV